MTKKKATKTTKARRIKTDLVIDVESLPKPLPGETLTAGERAAIELLVKHLVKHYIDNLGKEGGRR